MIVDAAHGNFDFSDRLVLDYSINVTVNKVSKQDQVAMHAQKSG